MMYSGNKLTEFQLETTVREPIPHMNISHGLPLINWWSKLHMKLICMNYVLSSIKINYLQN